MFFTAFALVAVVLLLAPNAMLPPSPGLAIFTLWVFSHLAGQLFAILKAPPLLGMLISGIILRNFVPGTTVELITPACSSAIRSFGLTMILAIAGLEIDLTAVKSIGWVCLRLTVLPGVSEAFAVALLGHLMFGMPFSLALCMGFIIGAVSPAVVVTGMCNLQRQGYGVAQGIPSLVVAAASLDDIVAISGFSMASGCAFAVEGPWYAGALKGPLTMIIGVMCGLTALIVIAVVWKLPLGEEPEFMLGLCLVMTYGMSEIGHVGAGYLGSIVMCAAASYYWKRTGEYRMRTRALEMAVYIWGWIAEPLLFGTIGVAFNFNAISMRTLPTSIFIVLVCVFFVRVPMAFFAVSVSPSATRKTATRKERLFVALAWVPKATVQAALGSLPLEMVADHITDDKQVAQYRSWGVDILTTSVLSIILTAPIGLLVIQLLGTKWLRRDSAVQFTKVAEAEQAQIYGHGSVSEDELVTSVDECAG